MDRRKPHLKGNLLLFPLYNPLSGLEFRCALPCQEVTWPSSETYRWGETGMKGQGCKRGLQSWDCSQLRGPRPSSAHSEARIASFIFSHATVMSFCILEELERKGWPRVITCFRKL